MTAANRPSAKAREPRHATSITIGDGQKQCGEFHCRPPAAGDAALYDRFADPLCIKICLMPLNGE